MRPTATKEGMEGTEGMVLTAATEASPCLARRTSRDTRRTSSSTSLFPVYSSTPSSSSLLMVKGPGRFSRLLGWTIWARS